MIVLLTSLKCSCCKGYVETVQEIWPEAHIVDAASSVGKDLIAKYNIKGLPALVVNGKVLEGKFNKSYLNAIVQH